MSEPLSTTEIEDVLSSIRRLVAEDLRPSPAPQPTSGEGGRNKLILTPALRVVTAEGDANAVADKAAVVSNLGSGLAHAEWEPEAEDAASSDETLILELDQDLADHGWAVAEPDMAGADDEIIGFTPPDGSGLHDAETASAASFADGDETTPAEPTFVSVRRGGMVQDVPSWAQSDEAAEEETEHPQPEVVAGTIEPDPEWAEAAEADVRAELEQEAAAAEPMSFAGNIREDDGVSGLDQPGPAEAETIYDETLLREIVRDLLRDELQGAMGERITRNIRKLVRTEIARALATQDLT